ncbi:hypothetical protein SAMN05428954_5543 [Streptomyces sp. 2112.3]|nr:hypothetical protein BX261_1736 [Streptomyces sp. 2321.6]SEC33394.1 hypothetical protein SAMN05428940_1738 [Streptomyces sp. 2133.1]SEF04631.1 hypothetical protein SAMN05428954_5543 [Streptomyces sp. 2112.3]SNC66701.1 hypothetical protein SAMN06272741_1733 [Streptomyces sp. 2114.4]
MEPVAGADGATPHGDGLPWGPAGRPVGRRSRVVRPGRGTQPQTRGTRPRRSPAPSPLSPFGGGGGGGFGGGGEQAVRRPPHPPAPRRPGGADASARGPRSPSPAVDLSRLGSDVIPDPAPVDPSCGRPAAAVPRRQRAALRLGVVGGGREAADQRRAREVGGPRRGARAGRPRVRNPGPAAEPHGSGGHVGVCRSPALRTGRAGSPGGSPRRPGRRPRSWGPCRSPATRRPAPRPRRHWRMRSGRAVRAPRTRRS